MAADGEKSMVSVAVAVQEGGENDKSTTVSEEHANAVAPTPTVTSQKLVKLPLSRVKALMKSDPDLSLASQEAVFIISKATELFIETIAKDAYVYAQRGKRKTLQRKDLDIAVDSFDEFAFLEGLNLLRGRSHLFLLSDRRDSAEITQKRIESGFVQLWWNHGEHTAGASVNAPLATLSD